MMNLRGFLRLLSCAGLLILAGAVGTPAFSAATPEPGIQDLIVLRKKDRILIFATLTGAFSPKIFEALNSGVTTRITYEMALMRPRRFLFDSLVSSHQLIHQVKYDALKKEYAFSQLLDAEETVKRVTTDRDEVIDMMSDVNGTPIASAQELQEDTSYYVRIRARMNSVNFVFPFNYLLTTFLERQTSWAISAFFGPRGM